MRNDYSDLRVYNLPISGKLKGLTFSHEKVARVAFHM